jgi:hypothetical protein
MFWPKGYSARTNPLRVVDGQGGTVAVDGHRVELGGGTVGFDNPRTILGCGEVQQVIVINRPRK